MNHWHREHFSTHQFYADVLFDFSETYPDEEIDLLGSGRDRHGYDCVLIRVGEGQPATRYIQLKSTEKDDAPLVGIHGRMLLGEFREIVQIWVSSDGRCEYYFLSDFGRLAHLSLAIAGRRLSEKSRVREAEVVAALKPLTELIGGFEPPGSYPEIQNQWGSPRPNQWPVWDGQLAKCRGPLWSKVIRPLAGQFKFAFPDWRQDRYDVDSRWTRKITRKYLADHIFR